MSSIQLVLLSVTIKVFCGICISEVGLSADKLDISKACYIDEYGRSQEKLERTGSTFSYNVLLVGFKARPHLLKCTFTSQIH